MPRMNGLDAAREMRRERPVIPILMVATSVSPQLIQEAQKVGVIGVCAKTDPACVVEAVEALLEDIPYFQN
jgi:DNA-binding NarL/FixJ family response regulator